MPKKRKIQTNKKPIKIEEDEIIEINDVDDDLKQSKLSFQKKEPKEKFIELPESYSQDKEPLIEGNTLIDKKELKRQRGRPKKEKKKSKSEPKLNNKKEEKKDKKDKKGKREKTNNKVKIQKGVDYKKGKYNIRVELINEDKNL